MSSERRRVEEVAGLLGVTPAAILSTCRDLGIGVASPQSMLDAAEVSVLRNRLGSRRKTAPARRPERRVSATSNSAQAGAWDALVKHKLAGTPVQGLVTAVVKGGLLVDVGVRGFMPASQVDSGWVEDLSTFVGTKISARVIDLDPSRRSVVLSRRELVDRRRQQRASELRDELAPGDEVESVVLKKIDRSFVVRVDDALEVWIPEDQVTREVEHLSIGDRIPVTVCDISDTRVIGSFRLESSIERNAEPSTDEVNSIASESGGLLKVVDGLLTVEVSIDHALPEHLSQAVEMATRGGVAVLFVASEPGVKREVRRLVQSGQVPGVDARRSRQASDGLWLTLNPKI